MKLFSAINPILNFFLFEDRIKDQNLYNYPITRISITTVNVFFFNKIECILGVL